MASEEEKQDEIPSVFISSTVEMRERLAYQKAKLEAQENRETLVTELAQYKEREKWWKREKKEKPTQEKTIGDTLLQFLLFLGSLVFVESSSILIGRHFVDDLGITILMALGALFSVGILIYIWQFKK